MEFAGFHADDFAVFEVEGFSARMPLLWERVKPKLTLIGEAITTRLSEAMGETLYPHVAQHLRRTVNPPVETWVAFAREKRAYKPFVHLRVAVSAEKVRVTVFVEDYAEDKLLFADNLDCHADRLAKYLAKHPEILAYEIQDAKGNPLSGKALKGDVLRAFAARMKKVKGQHAIFGIAFPKETETVANGATFLDAILFAANALKPLYELGKEKHANRS